MNSSSKAANIFQRGKRVTLENASLWASYKKLLAIYHLSDEAYKWTLIIKFDWKDQFKETKSAAESVKMHQKEINLRIGERVEWD